MMLQIYHLCLDFLWNDLKQLFPRIAGYQPAPLFKVFFDLKCQYGDDS